MTKNRATSQLGQSTLKPIQRTVRSYYEESNGSGARDLVILPGTFTTYKSITAVSILTHNHRATENNAPNLRNIAGVDENII